jgi:23S rRNA (adenine2503-C2)-methyltransferase
VKVLQSGQAPLKKIIFDSADNYSYHTVSMYSAEQAALIVCASSQIGCTEDCSFCATGSFPFIRNLNVDEMKQQYLLGLESMSSYTETNNLDLLCIILEGMGEASHNIDNSLRAFGYVFADLSDRFDRIVFRISSAGNINFIKKFRRFIASNSDILDHVSFQVQLSLHSPFEHERSWLMPSVSKKNRLQDILREFHLLSEFLGNTLVCNYMLLNFPQGGCNYTDRHLHEIVKLLDPQRVEIKLTTYSETNRGFSSPDESTFDTIKAFFIRSSFQTKVRTLIGNDIRGACGMLHYE